MTSNKSTLLTCECGGGVLLPSDKIEEKAYLCPACQGWIFPFDVKKKEISVGEKGYLLNIDSDGRVHRIKDEVEIISKQIASSGEFRGKQVWCVNIGGETVFYPAEECLWSYVFLEEQV